jgi:hypothetical protein
MSRRGIGWVLCGLLVVAAGCRRAQPPTGGGATEAAQAFAEAIVARDWPAAHGRLAAESKGDPDQFARLAARYRAGLGFEPATVHVTACEEHGADAIAHITLTGKGPHRGRFKETLTLRNAGGTWAVVLPANFGRVR